MKERDNEKKGPLLDRSWPLQLFGLEWFINEY
jgi:hypothetical protein